MLRIFAAFLAGVNRYSWGQFLFYNATGGIVWAAIFGFGGYAFGDAFERVAGPLGKIALGLAVLGVAPGLVDHPHPGKEADRARGRRLSRPAARAEAPRGRAG